MTGIIPLLLNLVSIIALCLISEVIFLAEVVLSVGIDLYELDIAETQVQNSHQQIL